MENRNVRQEGRNELVYQPAAAMQLPRGERSLSREELSLLVEFFQLLDRWDRQEVLP
jgi:hypothetical protein